MKHTLHTYWIFTLFLISSIRSECFETGESWGDQPARDDLEINLKKACDPFISEYEPQQEIQHCIPSKQVNLRYDLKLQNSKNQKRVLDSRLCFQGFQDAIGNCELGGSNLTQEWKFV